MSVRNGRALYQTIAQWLCLIMILGTFDLFKERMMARQKGANNHSLHGVNEHFELFTAPL